MTAATIPTVLDTGKLSFSIESSILRELGERLVKQPEVAMIELVKNAYDADATTCTISYDSGKEVKVKDNGVGMTLHQFTNGWMRIGTSSKEATFVSDKFGRHITGEKGIGRFAVRFLGRVLHLESIADDPERKCRTLLTADFDWPKFDHHEDLGKVEVPYRLETTNPKTPTGTTLTITRLRPEVSRLNLKKVRSGSIGVLTPLRSLFRQMNEGDKKQHVESKKADPGFALNIKLEDDEDADVAAAILDASVLCAQLRLTGDKLDLKVFRRGDEVPYFEIIGTYPNELHSLYADIRFAPWRKGAFADLPVSGHDAYKWFVKNSGVTVFDRNFRVLPYGTPSDDWLKLQADSARNRRDPRSSIAKTHFPMASNVRTSTSENWMLRLPQSAQLIGLVQVVGRRHGENALKTNETVESLVASADREGFVENNAFRQLKDLVRGMAEAIAFVDRKLDLEAKKTEREALVASVRKETRSAIREIQTNPNIAKSDKAKIVSTLAKTQQLSELQEKSSQERERQLEVMSLLGVVAGFMTHEFGVALQELENTHKDLVTLAKDESRFEQVEKNFSKHIKSLKEFVTYSSGYIQGAKIKPTKPYPVKPRLQQVMRIFGRYADERNIKVEISADPNLMAPLVPASLYNGIALNLYTNALKAVTATVGTTQGVIAFRSWNDKRWHYLEVSDTGIGIASALKDRVFDPLFSTTESRNDPLGSGMGLGLALVRRGAEAFGGQAELVPPPPDFTTCVRVRLPITE